MRESFYALQGFWKRKDVALNIKRNAFKGMVFNTAISGMEAEICTRQELIRIDKEVIRLARKTLGGRACEKNEEMTIHKAWTNKRVRQEMRISTVESEMARRRVRWFKTMVANPEDNRMIRSALSGKMTMDDYNETLITPWMEQLLQDLTILKNRGNYTLDIVKGIRETNNTSYLWELKELVTWDEDLLREEEMEEAAGKGSRITIEDKEKCTICEYEGTKQQVAMHSARKHNMERAMKKYIMGNQCPLCETLFADRRTAIQHAERTKDRYEKTGEIKCVTKKKNKKVEYKKTLIKEYDCEECQKSYQGTKAEEHLKEHIIGIITGEQIKKEEKEKGAALGVLGMLMRGGVRTIQ
jgi:hypothetical protein